MFIRPFNPNEWIPSTDEDFYINTITGDIVRDSVYKEAVQGKPDGINIIRGLIPASNSKSDGVKYDDGKPLVGTLCRIFPNALLEVGKCIEFGTHKYPEVDNWQRVDDAFNRYQDAMIRHLLKHNIGKELDEETGLYHLSHMVWNSLAILELYIRSKDETRNDKENNADTRD